MRRLCMRAGLVSVFLAAAAMPAAADATAYLGVMTAGGPRQAVGFAYTDCPGLVGYELELMTTVGPATSKQSSVGDFSANVIVQPRSTIHGFQLYGTAGFGLYGEVYDHGGSGEVLATNIGGGARVGLAGPLKLRLDYRLFLLGDTPDAGPPGIVIHKHPQRILAGLTLEF